MKTSLALAAVATALLFHVPVFAAAPITSAPAWWGDHERGWFWYNEKEPEQPEETEEAPPPAPPPAPSPTTSAPPQSDTVALNTAWLRENLPIYRDRAIDHPTYQNIRAYRYLQLLMTDRAETFAHQWERVTQIDPFLDENTRRPLLSAAARQTDEEAGRHVVAALKTMAKETGLMFFYRSDCEPCMLEAPLLKSFEREFGFSVFPVSIDGRPLPRGEFPNFHVDQGQAQQLGVQSTPTLFLYHKGQVTPIAEGVFGFQELSTKILLAGVMAKILTEDDFDMTRPAKTDAPQMVPPEIERKSLSPDKLIGILRGRLGREMAP